ncbi:MAG: glycoside hydrolase family 16 protein [Spirochaetales bacterium]|nr:glycoside hydrolase family 16 protein [Spirochaetales bacterium]
MKKTITCTILFLLVCIVLATGCRTQDSHELERFTAPPPSDSEDTYTPPDGTTLVWSDEFENRDIDLDVWSYETRTTGWSPEWNGEWQRYTYNGTGGPNACINEGVLVIRALETTGGDGGYSSARIVTGDRLSWQYGTIAARMQLPYGQGMWPAFWMMGIKGGWPACGEIDILEMIGGGVDGIQDRTAHCALHWDNGGHQSAGQETICGEKLASDWHYYEVEWDETTINIKFDGNAYFTQPVTAGEFSEFHQPFYILLNLAVGGEWPGPPDKTTVFPQYLYIDWVRVYQ